MGGKGKEGRYQPEKEPKFKIITCPTCKQTYTIQSKDARGGLEAHLQVCPGSSKS